MPRLSRKLSLGCKVKVFPLSAKVIPLVEMFCESNPASVAIAGGDTRIAGQLQIMGGTLTPPLWDRVGVVMPVGQVHTDTEVPDIVTEVAGGSLVTTIGMGIWVSSGSTVGWGAQAVTHNRISTINESFI